MMAGILQRTTSCSLLCVLLAGAGAFGQARDDNRIDVTVAQGEQAARTFLLKTAIDCPRERYEFQLESDSAFLSLPVDRVELSRTESTGIRVLFDANGLEAGEYAASVTVKCVDCRPCRTRNKKLDVLMTVEQRDLADDESIEVGEIDIPRATVVEIEEQPDAGEEPPARRVPVPEVVGLDRAAAEARLRDAGLVPSIAGNGDAETDSATMTSQSPLASVLVPAGSTVSIVLSVAGGSGFDTRWLLFALPIAIVAAVVFRQWSSGAGGAAAGKIEVRSEKDPGTQRVWPDISERQKTEIRVRLIEDAGRQSIEGDPAPAVRGEA